MSHLKKNVLANVGGQAVSALVGIFLIPLYLKYLGKEGYGLVALFISIQSLAAILDLGLSTAANREFSRMPAADRDTSAGRDLLRTLEYAYYATGLALFTFLALSAGWIARNWVQAEQLDPATIRNCIIIAAATIGFRWPDALYYGTLRGQERQVEMNLLYSSFSGVRAVCTLLVLIFVARSVSSFYVFQLIFGVIEILILRQQAWKGVGGLRGGPARFQGQVIRGVWRYALGVSWVSIFAIGLKQVDKLFVSRLLPIEQLGFYTTAAMAGMALGKISSPVQAAIFPRLSKLYAREDKAGLVSLFDSSAQLFAFLSCAGAAGLMFFAREILFAWTRSHELADAAAMTLSITALAMMFNGMMSAPFSLILASGHTRISLYMNGLGLLCLGPATYFLVKAYGMTGAATAWLIFNVIYYLVAPAALARKIPELNLKRFYLEDTLPFGLLSAAIFGLGRWLSAGQGTYLSLAAACACGCIYLAAGLLISTNLRHMAATAPGVVPFLKRFRGGASPSLSL